MNSNSEMVCLKNRSGIRSQSAKPFNMTSLSAVAVVVTVAWLGTVALAAENSPSATNKAIRINAGATTSWTDESGNTWLPDQGFEGGRTVDRGKIEIAGTTMPTIYQTEHYGMKTFKQAVPNGVYTIRLHFAETFPKITAKGQRVFSVKVEDQEIKDLDVVARAGSPKTALVETVNVNVTDGSLDITFTPGIQNPEINGIEIIPK